MDWKIFYATFAAIFAAELADKTQLVSITLSSKTGKPLSVWLGSVAAYMVITALSVLLGTIAAKYLRPEVIRFTAAGIFVLCGILLAFGKI